MVKTVLVTGSLGYIGSRLTQYLAESGMRCIGLDTGFFRDCELYPPNDPFTIAKDVRELSKEDLDGIDAVVHLAGISNDPFGSLDPARIYDPTRAYTLSLAKLCKEMGVGFVFASSCSVYGVGKAGYLDENSETSPQTPYSLNKLQIENDLKEIADSAFSPVIFRFATVFGLSPRMRFDIVLNMLVGMAVTTRKIVLNSDGKAWRPLVHIDDVCQAIKYGVDLRSDLSDPIILNVGDKAHNYQILQLAEMIRERVPGCEIELLASRTAQEKTEDIELVRDRKIQDGVDSRTYSVSFDLIKEVIPSFRCEFSAGRGIESMVKAFSELGLSSAQFKNTDFYRLQKIESLWDKGLLTDDLFWR